MSAVAELYESILTDVASLDRSALAHDLGHFPGSPPLDFTEDYLSNCTTDQMRHLLAAALWRYQSRQIAQGAMDGTANAYAWSDGT